MSGGGEGGFMFVDVLGFVFSDGTGGVGGLARLKPVLCILFIVKKHSSCHCSCGQAIVHEEATCDVDVDVVSLFQRSEKK